VFLSDNGGAAERPMISEAGAVLGSRTSYEGYGTQWAWLSCSPFRRYKRFVNEGGVSTPCIIAWPAGIEESRQSKFVHGPAHLIDLLPTCLELASVKHTGQWKGHASPAPEGVSLLSALRTGELRRDVPLFWEHEGNRAVRRGPYKLVAEYGKGWQLYDLSVDRAEQDDLAQRLPQIVREMVGLYDAWAQRCGVEPWSKALGKGMAR
jgi:arylsulfatase